METPSSMRRVTCSQAFVASQKSKKEDSISRSRTNGGNSERSALLDITNDSPIVGLATAGLSEKTPPSSAVKNMVRVKSTPGSGEALLRGQVKTLLQKVEEEAEFVNKAYSGERPPFRVALGLPGPSPAQLLAPTPANTPQVPSLSVLIDGDVVMVSSVGGENALNINAPIQVAEAVKPEEPALGECLINRALLFDSPEKPEVADSSSSSVISSTLSYQGSCNIRSYTEKSTEDDSSSAWSVQVNVSVQDEDADDEGIEYFDGEGEDDEESEDVEDYGEESFDDLCVGLSKMTVQEFAGKHTRFVYNSDDEIEGEEEVTKNVSSSPGVLVLKGLPAPEGKHLRFQDDEE